VIDLATADRGVELKASQFRDAQSTFDTRKEALDQELAAAFYRVWPGKAGDRIRANTRSGPMEGRAVILRDGTRMGLYVDNRRERRPVLEPYSENVRILPFRRRARDRH
jgi:hypothetical protein